ncbi:hypothetical protein [Streptomyces sp. NPDC001985]|uniref:hypothetical protein n=1 Tax=Streptomyces sp. NPDC001985 TaxID=3154406 RepID=UPI00331A4C4D
MNPSSRYTAIAAALIFAALEVTAVHLLLGAGTAVLLCTDAVVVAVTGGCAAALLRRREPVADDPRAEARARHRAVRYRTDRESSARGCGRPAWRP